MTELPRVSAVIPAFDSEATIARALDSAVRQSRPANEIIVVDDCSSDATREIVSGYAGKGVRLIALPSHKGASGARNAGIHAATGELVAFPTETVYGLGADAASTEAVRRLLIDFAANEQKHYDHPQQSQDEIEARLSNATSAAIDARVAIDVGAGVTGSATERVADVPIYFTDPLVRRAPSLQKTRDAKPPLARVNAATLAALRLTDGGAARVRQVGGEAMMKVAVDASVPDGCVRVAAGHATTSMLGPMFGPIGVEPV